MLQFVMFVCVCVSVYVCVCSFAYVVLLSMPLLCISKEVQTSLVLGGRSTLQFAAFSSCHSGNL